MNPAAPVTNTFMHVPPLLYVAERAQPVDDGWIRRRGSRRRRQAVLPALQYLLQRFALEGLAPAVLVLAGIVAEVVQLEAPELWRVDQLPARRHHRHHVHGLPIGRDALRGLREHRARLGAGEEIASRETRGRRDAEVRGQRGEEVDPLREVGSAAGGDA